MRQLKSILVATDLLPSQEPVLGTAAHLAGVFGARLTLLHVQEIEKIGIVWYHKKQMGEVLLEDAAQQLRKRDVIVSDATVTLGAPQEGILKRATEIDADLIVIGAGTRSKTGDFQLGPIAQAIIEHAQQPVLTIRQDRPQPVFQSLLCPIDHSPVSRRGLLNAIRLAKALGARLHVLSVIPEVSWFTAAEQSGQITDVQAAYATQWSEAFHKFLEPISFEGVDATLALRTGRPADEILEAVRQHDADLIVMGTTGKSGLSRILIGSTTRRVLNRLPCSLLTVKAEDVLDQDYEAEIHQIHLLLEEGQAYLDAHNELQAVTKIDAALRLNPYHVAALEARATVCDRLGEHDRAARCRRRIKILQREPVAT